MSPAPAKYYRNNRKDLTYEEAVRVIAFMPYLVAESRSKLLPEMINKRVRYRFPRDPIIKIPFQVAVGPRTYTFKKQPFRVMRQITLTEFRAAAPWACVGGPKSYYYEIATD